MGTAQLPLLSLHSKETPDPNGNKLTEAKAKRRLKTKNQTRPRTTSVLMKRRAVREGSRRVVNPIEKKVKTLKRLVPNNGSTGLEGLYRDTAEYILSLQMRVKVMQILVKVLTASS
ncbi:hypothetical protein HRI_004638600 [Hibiscus trionum]|uniref:BHLH domain-containing protein n=1 Tax=Hibiscus trionum TaxID=183268 RepID=A0A9W7JA78_HIBTR|nr:hypothetical protein HRI_004638600 [Hibiscus trionum]